MKQTSKNAQSALKKFANKKKAVFHTRFFKTGKGQYGEGDVFIGVTVPQIRSVQKVFKDLPQKEVLPLLYSKIHEERLLGALILAERAKRADGKELSQIYSFYLKHAKRINNWDLVDLSAPSIVGRHLERKPRAILYRLVRSPNLWKRRIAIVGTFHFIRLKDFEDVYKLASLLLKDEEDLMHKATGWMLREAGKRDSKRLYAYLKKNHAKMPRTMLRYAIEKYPEKVRQDILAGKFA